ncbi:MAG: PEP-CTERM sorting domain-containing protein [Planctomyces sp.]|nr:PEP-CTERM sorting domain-containing protein [Planctomyces sp.]
MDRLHLPDRLVFLIHARRPECDFCNNFWFRPLTTESVPPQYAAANLYVCGRTRWRIAALTANRIRAVDMNLHPRRRRVVQGITLATVILLTSLRVDAGTTITFDVDKDGNAIRNGQILDAEFNGPTFNNLVITAQNLGGGYNLAVAFNSNPALNPASPDPDLQRTSSGWRGGNIATKGIDGIHTDLGNLLIIQDKVAGNPSNPDANGDGILNIKPNDEESSPAGRITFDFTGGVPLTSFGLTLVDVAGSLSGYYLAFYSGDQQIGGNVSLDAFTSKTKLNGAFYDSSVAFKVSSTSNQVANILAPVTLDKLAKAFPTAVIQPFDKVVFYMKGGGGIARIKFDTLAPEPGSLALMGLGGAGIAAMARRRKRPLSAAGSDEPCAAA